MPDYPLGETLDFKFTTRQFSTGAPFLLAGTPAVEVYEDNDITQITVGDTLTANFDGITGLNNVRIIATSGNGYEVGKSYAVVISAGTVDSVSVVGEVIAQFSIERSPALRPTTAGQTLDVAATGEAGIDLGNTLGNYVAADFGAASLNGKGDWNIGKTGYSLTQAFPTNFADMAIVVTTGLVDITQAAADKAWSTAARVLTANGIPVGGIATNAIDAAALATDAAAEIRDSVYDGAMTELAALPGASPTLKQAIAFLYMALKNQMDITATAQEIHNDAAVVLGTGTLSDDGTTFRRTKYV